MPLIVEFITPGVLRKSCTKYLCVVVDFNIKSQNMTVWWILITATKYQLKFYEISNIIVVFVVRECARHFSHYFFFASFASVVCTTIATNSLS